MGYWGCRPLIFCLFISVLIVGCTPSHETLPSTTPTEYPLITLQVRRIASSTPPARIVLVQTPTLPPPPPATPVIYIAQPGDTLLNIADRFGVQLAALEAANHQLNPQHLQIGQELIIPNPENTGDGLPILRSPTPPPLALAAPTCYETRTNPLLCLGAVHNTLSYDLERVIVRVQLYDLNGILLDNQDTVIEQSLIPAGETAPYRVVFSHENVEAVYAVAYLLRADAAAQSRERFLWLRVKDEALNQQAGQVVVSATLYNPGPQPVAALRMVVTLSDAAGDVVGYRVLQSAIGLTAGEERLVQIPVMLYGNSSTPSHTLYIEAHAAR